MKLTQSIALEQKPPLEFRPLSPALRLTSGLLLVNIYKCLPPYVISVESFLFMLELTTPENTITYHNGLFYHPKILHKDCFQFLLGPLNSQEKLKTMLMQNFGVTNKEHYGMLWYFL